MTHSLLQPRYIVEANYPNSPFQVGDILVVKHHTMYKDGEVFALEDDDNVSSWITYAKDFPNIFRKLNWWEHRELDEMPRWVKWKHKDDKRRSKHVIEVHWSIKDGELMIKRSIYSDAYWFKVSDYEITPATKEEYLNYLKSNQNDSK